MLPADLRFERITGQQLRADQTLIDRLRPLTLDEGRRLDTGMTRFLGMLERHTSSKSAVLAKIGDAIVGWASMQNHRYCKRTQINVYVTPPYRRIGVGNALMTVVKQHATYRLEVGPHDPASYRFFKSQGMRGTYNEVVGTILDI